MGSDFDIYQTDSGYVAVTSEVRRQILNALAKKDRQLPELVKLTRKAKPTLSSVHMKELLAQKLVEEIHHPTDKRRKIYRLKARRIGSSNLPVEQLRGAVRQYAVLAPDAPRAALSFAVEAIADAPPDADAALLSRQARRLGILCAPQFQPANARGWVTGLATFLEREGLARPLRLDLEAMTLEMELAPGLAPDASEERLARLLSAFSEGIAAGRGQEARVEATRAGPRRFTFHVQAPPAEDAQ